MPQLATITVNDSSAVAHSFTPDGITNNLAALSEKTGVPVGNPSMAVSLRGPVKGSTVYKIRITIVVPQTATVDGVDKVTHSAQAHVDLLVSDVSSETEREDLVAFVINALGHADINSVITDLSPMY